MNQGFCIDRTSAFKAAAQPVVRWRPSARRSCPSVRVNATKMQLPGANTCGCALSAIVAAGLLSYSTPAFAQIQTVPAASITDYAKPIPKAAKVPKETIWVLFIGGAASLFGLVLTVENYAGWFPAIAKANQAIASYRNMTNQAEQEIVFSSPPPSSTPSPPINYPEIPPAPSSSTDAVLAGLAEARANVLASSSTTSTASATPTATDTTVNQPLSSSTSAPASTSDSPSSPAHVAATESSSQPSGQIVAQNGTSSDADAADSDDKKWEKQLGEEKKSASQLMGLSDQQLEKYIEARRALDAFKEQSAALKEQQGNLS